MERSCVVQVGDERQPTFCVAGHHYAIVPLTVPDAAASFAYEVRLDGDLAWPPAGLTASVATISLPLDDGEIDIVGGSCRQQAPEPLWRRRRASTYGDLGPDALATLAHDVEVGNRSNPHLLLLTGDQVYADEQHRSVVKRMESRRGGPPAEGRPGVASYEEYTWLYQHTWAHPSIRRLLATVPSLMIFDDHDIIDDWNVSQSWAEDIGQEPWWSDRIEAGLMAYWVYQHLGNMTAEQRANDELFASVREADDGAAVLRVFARKVSGGSTDRLDVSWSYAHTFDDRLAVIVLDCRNARVLKPDRRSMLSPRDWAWLEQTVATTPAQHLLIVTSVPWLLPHGIQRLERWVSSMADDASRSTKRRVGEFLRRAIDLEHWAAFGDSAARLTEVLDQFRRTDPGRGSVAVLAGDVHFAYTATVDLPSGGVAHQVVASPLRQTELTYERAARRFAMAKPLRKVLHRHAELEHAVTNGPWFRNNLATLRYRRDRASVSIALARTHRRHELPRLETVLESELE